MRDIAATLLAALIFGPAEGEGLAQYRWEVRPILVFSAEGDPRLDDQIARLEAAEDALLERDTVVIVDTEERSPLRARFEPGPFTVVLVGKDGTEKMRADRVVEPGEIAALIDTMPMRRREMREADPGGG